MPQGDCIPVSPTWQETGAGPAGRVQDGHLRGLILVPQIGRVPLECKWNCGLKKTHHNNKENKEKVNFFCIGRERRNNFVCRGRAGMDNLFEIKSLILPE